MKATNKRCPVCGGGDLKHCYSGGSLIEGSVRRTYKCPACKLNVWTKEELVAAIALAKRSGEIEDFSRAKLKASLRRAIKASSPSIFVPENEPILEAITVQCCIRFQQLPFAARSTKFVGEIAVLCLNSAGYARAASLYEARSRRGKDNV